MTILALLCHLLQTRARVFEWFDQAYVFLRIILELRRDVNVPCGYEVLTVRAPCYAFHWTSVPSDCANFSPDLVTCSRSTHLRTPPAPPSAGPTPCQCFRATCYPHATNEPTETLSSNITEALSIYPEGRRAFVLTRWDGYGRPKNEGRVGRCRQQRIS